MDLICKSIKYVYQYLEPPQTENHIHRNLETTLTQISEVNRKSLICKGFVLKGFKQDTAYWSSKKNPYSVHHTFEVIIKNSGGRSWIWEGVLSIGEWSWQGLDWGKGGVKCYKYRIHVQNSQKKFKLKKEQRQIVSYRGWLGMSTLVHKAIFATELYSCHKKAEKWM